MNGFAKFSAAMFAFSCGMAFLSGCAAPHPSGQQAYGNLVDLCWPERYNAMAAKSVNQAFAGQVNNGKVLDNTIYADMFVPGKAELTLAGYYKLDVLAKRRPAPPSKLYLQTAPDVTFDPTNPNDFIYKRADLNNRRKEAIITYLSARVAGRPVPWDIVIHDPPDVGMPGSLPITGDINYANKSVQERGAAFGGRVIGSGGGGISISGQGQ